MILFINHIPPTKVEFWLFIWFLLHFVNSTYVFGVQIWLYLLDIYVCTDERLGCLDIVNLDNCFNKNRFKNSNEFLLFLVTLLNFHLFHNCNHTAWNLRKLRRSLRIKCSDECELAGLIVNLQLHWLVLDYDSRWAGGECTQLIQVGLLDLLWYLLDLFILIFLFKYVSKFLIKIAITLKFEEIQRGFTLQKLLIITYYWILEVVMFRIFELSYHNWKLTLLWFFPPFFSERLLTCQIWTFFYSKLFYDLILQLTHIFSSRRKNILSFLRVLADFVNHLLHFVVLVHKALSFVLFFRHYNCWMLFVLLLKDFQFFFKLDIMFVLSNGFWILAWSWLPTCQTVDH